MGKMFGPDKLNENRAMVPAQTTRVAVSGCICTSEVLSEVKSAVFREFCRYTGHAEAIKPGLEIEPRTAQRFRSWEPMEPGLERDVLTQRWRPSGLNAVMIPSIRSGTYMVPSAPSAGVGFGPFGPRTPVIWSCRSAILLRHITSPLVP